MRARSCRSRRRRERKTSGTEPERRRVYGRALKITVVAGISTLAIDHRQSIN